jgi:hypothetical protein
MSVCWRVFRRHSRHLHHQAIFHPQRFYQAHFHHLIILSRSVMGDRAVHAKHCERNQSQQLRPFLCGWYRTTNHRRHHRNDKDNNGVKINNLPPPPPPTSSLSQRLTPGPKAVIQKMFAMCVKAEFQHRGVSQHGRGGYDHTCGTHPATAARRRPGGGKNNIDANVSSSR